MSVLVKGGGGKKPEGQYVWEKLTAEGGDFIDYVVSSDAETYPNDGELKGYWYKLVEGFENGFLFNKFGSNGLPTNVKIKAPTIPDNFMKANDSSYNVFVDYLTHIEIETSTIGLSAFRYRFYKNAPKVKIKATGIGQTAFQYCFIGGPAKIWISKDCLTIFGKQYDNGAFHGVGSGAVFYCEASSKPSGWETYWNYRGQNNPFTVNWGVTEAEFDAL